MTTVEIPVPTVEPIVAQGRPIASPGSMNVDWEERWNVDRLRTYRLGRARDALAASDLGAMLLFDFNNIRYVTSTHIGEWARDKMTRYALLSRGGDPHVWDFGSAAKHHRLNCPWLRTENIHAGMIGLRGAVAPDAGMFRRAAEEIAGILRAEGAADMPIGVDIVEPPMVAALEAEGLTVRDAQQVMLDAREVKSIDEIILLNTACAMVDGAYQYIAEHLKPGCPRERARRRRHASVVRDGLRARRQHQRRVGRAMQPTPARVQRPAHPPRRPGVLRHHPHVHRLQDLLLPHVRGRHRERRAARRLQAGARMDRRIDRTDATGRRHRRGRLASGRRPRSSGSRTRWSASGSSSVTASGLFLHERPIISRLNSLDHPVEIKEGMVIALETYCPAKDGYSAARIEEEVVVTRDGPRVITKFPSDELFVANAY